MWAPNLSSRVILLAWMTGCLIAMFSFDLGRNNKSYM